LTGTPVAGFILIHPGVQIKAVEGNSLFSNGNFNEIRPDLCVEAIPVHPEIKGGISQPYKPGIKG